MASRALGAFFALATAAAFVVSIASSAWWAGHPVVEGKEITVKHVYAGPLGATGCNTGGDGSCESIAVASDIQLIGYGALGATALATIFALVLLWAASKVSKRRRGIALASLLFTLLAAGAGGALLALGPGIEASQHVEVPIGWGTFVFGGAVLSSLLASLVTRKLEPEPLRLKSSRAAAQPAARDVRDVQQVAAFAPAPQPPPQAPQPPPQAPQPPPQPLLQAPLRAPVAFAATMPAQSVAMIAPPRAMNAEPLPAMAPSPLNAQPLPGIAPSPLDAQPLPGMAPSPLNAQPLPGMAPARAKAPSVPPPAPLAPRPKSPSEPPPRTKAPSAAGSDVYRPVTAAAGDALRPKSPSDAPRDALRPKSPSEAPRTDALRPKSPSEAPRADALRAKSPSDAPRDALRAKSPSDAPRDALRPKSPSDAQRPNDPLRPKPPTGSPFDKRPLVPAPGPNAAAKSPPSAGVKPLAAAGAKPLPAAAKPLPGTPAAKPLPGVPAPAPGAAAKPLPGVPRPARSSQRIPTQHATPPPALPAVLGTDSGAAKRGGRPGIAVPATRSPTLATAVPPPPAETDAKPSSPPAAAPKPRADTDMRTGKNRIADVTETGIPPAPPRATTDVEDADGVREQTAQTLMAPPPPPPRDPEDLLKTFEQNPKSFEPSSKTFEPSPKTFEPAKPEQPKTPIPTLERTAAPIVNERPVQVPISTAPSTLPPPKQLEAEPSGPSPACPQCEAPMAWVDEHLRFYCRQCRMYF